MRQCYTLRTHSLIVLLHKKRKMFGSAQGFQTALPTGKAAKLTDDLTQITSDRYDTGAILKLIR
jgi:hypothetical protein